MTTTFNIGNSIFSGLNDLGGIFVCGYEWGWSTRDQAEYESGLHDNTVESSGLEFTFSNKSPLHGEKAFAWRYDNRIIRWFELWGHPLDRRGTGGDLDKCIIQTNWCNTQANKITGNYYEKLTQVDQIDNFIAHVSRFRPRLIMFFGSRIVHALQDPRILSRFKECMGEIESGPDRVQKEFPGRRFFITFQAFEKCKVVSLPHPSSSRRLTDEYIKLFAPEMSELIQELKRSKGIE